mmetsp:Transcript_36757/g.85391  ORF Transcript_36757/g.85391 Transcript_36757/m.85391 type:complete len:248 (+) Transcript_36757:327-1070(+)
MRVMGHLWGTPLKTYRASFTVSAVSYVSLAALCLVGTHDLLMTSTTTKLVAAPSTPSSGPRFTPVPLAYSEPTTRPTTRKHCRRCARLPMASGLTHNVLWLCLALPRSSVSTCRRQPRRARRQPARPPTVAGTRCPLSSTLGTRGWPHRRRGGGPTPRSRRGRRVWGRRQNRPHYSDHTIPRFRGYGSSHSWCRHMIKRAVWSKPSLPSSAAFPTTTKTSRLTRAHCPNSRQDKFTFQNGSRRVSWR